MKKILTYVIFAVVLVGAATMSAGCKGYVYTDADSYTAGGGSATDVKNIDIDWVGGKVVLQYHTSNDIVFDEEPVFGSISDEMQMRWKFVDGTLLVKYCKSGEKLSDHGKVLTVSLPESFRGESIRVNTVSANVKTPVLKTDKLRFDSVSGSADLWVSDVSELVANSVSGNITLTQHGTCQSASVVTSSGNVDVYADKILHAQVTSVSGKIRADVSAANSIKINGTSSDITLRLPADAGFAAKLSSTSGKVSCKFSCMPSGNNYRYGDGSVSVELTSTSGSVVLEPLS